MTSPDLRPTPAEINAASASLDAFDPIAQTLEVVYRLAAPRFRAQALRDAALIADEHDEAGTLCCCDKHLCDVGMLLRARADAEENA